MKIKHHCRFCIFYFREKQKPECKKGFYLRKSKGKYVRICSLFKKKPTLRTQLAQGNILDLIKIQSLCERSFDLSDGILNTKCRKREISECKRVYCKAAKDITKFSLEYIGSFIGIGHATVLFHIGKFNDYKNEKSLICGKSLLDHYNFIEENYVKE